MLHFVIWGRGGDRH